MSERLEEGCSGVDWCVKHQIDHGHPGHGNPLAASLNALTEQAARAESGLAFDLGERAVALRGAVYAGERSVGVAGGQVTMFAVSVKTEKGVRDVMFCRRPELAKFIVTLLHVGDAVLGALIRSTESGDADEEDQCALPTR